MTGRLRIGEILVERGILTVGQVSDILLAQGRERLPFGVLAERMYGVDAQRIQEAWLQQYQAYAAQTTDSGLADAVEAITPRRLAGSVAERVVMARCA